MIEVVTILRVIPYIIASYVAWRKGFFRLMLATILASAITLASFFFPMSADVRGLLGSVFAYLLMMHALNLVPRKH